MANFVPAQSVRQLSYQNYLRHSWRWQIVRSVRLWLDGGRCRTCHATDNLNVHHASYLHTRMFPGAWLWIVSLVQEIDATICLCEKCHQAVHRYRGIAEFAD